MVALINLKVRALFYKRVNEFITQINTGLVDFERSILRVQ